jgi:hypothetical protein
MDPTLTTHRSPFCALRAHFEKNALRPMPALDAADAAAAPSGDRAAMAAILARFQLGEAGEGRVAREIDACHQHPVDEDYRHALKLFVKEEGRHARVLAAAVRALGGSLLARKASNHLFRACRRLLGLRFKVLVLLVAEVAGGTIYRELGERLGPGRLRAALAEIAADEDVHLGFHARFLRLAAASPPARWLVRLGLWVVGGAALLVVLAESWRDLGRLGLPPRSFARRMCAGLKTADSALLFPAASPTPSPGVAV